MNFCWITLNVKNLEQSIKFYNEIIGLNISSRFNAGDLKIAMLGEEQGTKIELIEGNNEINVSQHISIGFMVKSLDDAICTMKDNDIAIVAGPISPNPSTRFFFVNDPDGYRIQIVEQK